MFYSIIEFFFSVSLFINAVLYIPQIVRLYKEKHSREFSLFTFAGFCLINFFMMLHGVINKDLLLAIGSSFTLTTNLILTILIVVYRNKLK